MRRLLRDPLFHFTLIGAGFFAAFILLSGSAEESETITLSLAQQEQLVAAYTRVWRRPPDAQELKGLIDDWVQEEIAVREANALGLAANDLVVRRRLRQKYESFMDQIAASQEPSEAELAAWHTTHADDYREDARYSLEQRFFSSDRRADPQADALAALATLAGAGSDADPDLGDALAIPQRLDNQRETELANRFGERFSERLASLPTGEWTGPIPSAYGQHLVYVEHAVPGHLPELADVRAEVMRDWRADQLRAAREALYQDLLTRYDVTIESATGL